MNEEMATRRAFIHLVRSGKSVAAAAAEVGRSRAWGYKWWHRFREARDWAALQDLSRRPRGSPGRLPARVYQDIRRVRSVLEAEAAGKQHLGYIGAHAIRARLQEEGITPLPSISSIERELRRAGMADPKQHTPPPETRYPHLRPTRPHQLIQADITPKHLTGGTSIACFNAIDVVSRYPSGRQYLRRTAKNAVHFLLAVWQEQGLPEYQQVDNESCFSGGYTHPAVLGQVVRLALLMGVQLVFSPYYHPESNGTVERFHRDYSRFVWEKALLPDLAGVRQRSACFFQNYRTSRHHSRLAGRSPAMVQQETPPQRTVPADFHLPERLPLTAGQVHFIRAVNKTGKVKVLNLLWEVPDAQPHQGVWGTLNLSPKGATLLVFDEAPDATKRHLLVNYPFPLQEEVIPLAPEFRGKQRGWPSLRDLVGVLKALVYRPSTMS